MDKGFLGLALLMAATVALHVFSGGPEFADPFRVELPNDHLRAMALVLWHAVTVVLIVLAGTYLALARGPNRALLWASSALQLGWAALFLGYGLGLLGQVTSLPQWVIFLAFPLLAHLAERRRSRAKIRPAAA